MKDRLAASVDVDGCRSISKDLWGVFFEDISCSADGGLNSEMVQNGAFEYSRADRPDWCSFTSWNKFVPERSFAAWAVRTADPVAVENPHYVRAEIGDVAGGPAILENVGFDGMTFRVGETYRLSAWLRVPQTALGKMGVVASLIGDDGAMLASCRLEVESGDWRKVTADLVIPATDAGEIEDKTTSFSTVYRGKPAVAKQGRLRLAFDQVGVLDLDFISLEPATTFQGLEHCRADLVAALADLKPRFMRFPGGCITHGLGMDNMYHWNRTIGPVEHRPHNFNSWGYHQSFRLGFYEYLRLCETIGMKPLPVLAAGVSCQNTAQGPMPIALEDMPAYIEEVNGLIEFCNADPSDNPWAAKRAELGHPKPFGLEYLGIGNEDLIDPVFCDRFSRIFDAVRARHPEITIVGTVGPAPDGPDWQAGWAFAREAGVPIVDEHSYRSPSWWFHNLDHYDRTDRKGPKVYLGEYGSHDSQLINALAEAAFMGTMELNGDVVSMASYAPLFCKNGHNSWDPNLIYFDNEGIHPTYSYYVQRMFMHTVADIAWPVRLQGPTALRRQLPRTLGLRFTGGAYADIRNIVVATKGGQRVEVPDVEYRGMPRNAVLSLKADECVITMQVTYFTGKWGLHIRVGDVEGPNHAQASVGRRFDVGLIRDGSEYALDYTRETMDDVRPGTTWQIEIRWKDRGEKLELLVDGQAVAQGAEVPEEPRRTIAVSHDSAAGVSYVRLVNALPTVADIDLASVLDELGISAKSRATAKLVQLTGSGPYIGCKGEDAPTKPTVAALDLTGGVFEAPAWSLSILELSGAVAQ